MIPKDFAAIVATVETVLRAEVGPKRMRLLELIQRDFPPAHREFMQLLTSFRDSVTDEIVSVKRLVLKVQRSDALQRRSDAAQLIAEKTAVDVERLAGLFYLYLTNDEIFHSSRRDIIAYLPRPGYPRQQEQQQQQIHSFVSALESFTSAPMLGSQRARETIQSFIDQFGRVHDEIMFELEKLTTA